MILIMTYVDVALAKVHTSSKFFTYKTTNPAKVGGIIVVPFGKKNVLGIVMDVVNKPKFKTKEILSILPYRLPMNSIKLMAWMFNFYPDDYGLITRQFLPSGLEAKTKTRPTNVLCGKRKALPVPTPEQKIALKIINGRGASRIMLHGDTATGKTRVFIDKAKKIISSGKSVLILTPEIGLTPQLLTDVTSHINTPIVLTHSSLSKTQRQEAWKFALDNKQPSVFIGPRSALFLPYKNLGLIVMDEAHDGSYKQAQAPRYQSLHIASKLATLHKAQLIQSTATPNVSDYEMAKAYKYKFIRMRTKAGGNSKYAMQIIDITDRQNFTKSPHLSNSLIDAVSTALRRNQQVMLFLNRRGSARLIQCASCGWQAFCPRCGLPLIYHQDYHSIRCHSCGFKSPVPSACPSCKSIDLLFKNIGTKALVDHVSNLFPRARIMRFDSDSKASEQYYRRIKDIKNNQVDIIIGTQLISKGIDLPNLSVVGVINADTGLNLPDFRSEETTFQQLYQVTGRTGRGFVPSRAIVQTRLPQNPVIQAVLHRSWEEYYAYELSKRQSFKYPPLCYLAILKTSQKTIARAKSLSFRAFKTLSEETGLLALGPSPSFFEKKGSLYNWQIIVKANRRSLLVAMSKKLSNDWSIDIDPISLL